MNTYRIFVAAFNLLIGSLVFSNIQKTKLLQLVTTLMRWAAFITMIVLAFIKINQNTAKNIPMQPTLASLTGIPNFFGACIYAFMCHHSLPSIITPMRNKEKFKTVSLSMMFKKNNVHIHNKKRLIVANSCEFFSYFKWHTVVSWYSTF